MTQSPLPRISALSLFAPKSSWALHSSRSTKTRPHSLPPRPWALALGLGALGPICPVSGCQGRPNVWPGPALHQRVPVVQSRGRHAAGTLVTRCRREPTGGGPPLPPHVMEASGSVPWKKGPTGGPRTPIVMPVPRPRAVHSDSPRVSRPRHCQFRLSLAVPRLLATRGARPGGSEQPMFPGGPGTGFVSTVCSEERTDLFSRSASFWQAM